MGNEEERGIRARRKTLQIVRNHLPDGGIEPLRRLIREDPLRLARIRHRAQDALQHSARQLVRVRSEDARRIVKAEPREERLILRCRPCAAPRAAPHIRDLTDDPMHGAERRARQLGNNAPPFPPVLAAQLLPAEGRHIRPIKQHLPLDRSVRRQCTEERLTECRFSAAALADNRRHAPDGKVNADMIERRHVCMPVGIAHGQITHGKSFFLHHPRTSCRTSNRLRSSCPTMLRELTRRTIAMPGTMMRCGACR